VYFAGGILLLGVGQIMLWKPWLFFDLMERWKSRGAEDPSKLYLFSTRFGGVMMSLAGLGGTISPFL